MTGFLRRLRAAAADLALACCLALVGAVLVSGVPRFSDQLAVQALRDDIARANWAVRDLVVSSTLPPGFVDPKLLLDRYPEKFAPVLAGALTDRWYSATVIAASPNSLVPSGPRAQLSPRLQDGLTDAADLVDGRWPATPQPGGPAGHVMEMVLSAPIAQIFDMQVGDELTLFGNGPDAIVRLVGVFRAGDARAPLFDDLPTGLQVSWPMPEEPFEATVFTDATGLAVAADTLQVPPTFGFRYRLDERRLSPQPVDSLLTALAQTRRDVTAADAEVQTGLPRLLAGYQQQMRASRALLFVVGLGLLVPLLGATMLAARLAVERRRHEYALLRARGAGIGTVGLRALGESALTVPLAALAGWWIGTQVPGRGPYTGWAALAVGAVAMLAGPVAAAASVRSATPATARRDLAASRPSPARVTAEVSLVVFALVGAYLVRRRGVGPEQGVDVYLAAVPVLLALAGATLALRLLPVPAGWAARLAARSRGIVVFLGLSRVARSAAVHGAPLAVLIVAITTGLFTAAVATGIDATRDRVAATEVGADAQLRGAGFSTDTAGRLAAIPGVEAVAPLAVHWDAEVHASRGRRDGVARPATAAALVVDPAGYQRVLQRAAVDISFPPASARARPGDGPVPVVVSSALARQLGGVGATAKVTLLSRDYAVTVGGVVDEFPGLGRQTARFVVLPWQSLPAGAVIAPNRYLVAGERLDSAALRSVGDDGQRAYDREQRGRELPALANPSEVITWNGYRTELDRTGANSLLRFTFLVGVLGSVALALLAVGFAVLTGASARGQVLSRLRTMGLPPGGGRRLLLAELGPVISIATLLGAVLGAVLPGVLGRALDLTPFTAGAPTRTQVGVPLIAGTLALIVVALAVAVVVESTANRRMRLGEALRISEER